MNVFDDMAFNKVKAFINAYRNGSFELVHDDSKMDIFKHKYTIGYIMEQMASIIDYYDTLKNL